MGLRRQYNLAPCGWQHGAKWDHIRVGSRSGAWYCLSARVFLWGSFARNFSGTKRRTVPKLVSCCAGATFPVEVATLFGTMVAAHRVRDKRVMLTNGWLGQGQSDWLRPRLNLIGWGLGLVLFASYTAAVVALTLNSSVGTSLCRATVTPPNFLRRNCGLPRRTVQQTAEAPCNVCRKTFFSLQAWDCSYRCGCCFSRSHRNKIGGTFQDVFEVREASKLNAHTDTVVIRVFAEKLVGWVIYFL